MNQMINFPNLGIHWEHVGQKITIFGFDITYYGIIVGVAILIGIALTVWEAHRTEQDIEEYLTLSIFVIIFGTIGARMYYVLFAFDEFKGNLSKIFDMRSGGFAIYGAIIAGVITIVVYSKQKDLLEWKVLDTIIPALLVGQILGRIGNFFNREAFGEYTDSLFAMQLPIDAVRAADVTDKMRQHVEKIDGINMIQVNPTFLYEAIWCLVILIVILIYRKYEFYKGEIFLIYLIGYGVGRFVLEWFRVDKLRLPLLHLPVSQVVAVLTIIISVVLLYTNYSSGESGRNGFFNLRKQKKNNELILPK